LCGLKLCLLGYGRLGLKYTFSSAEDQGQA
jgi:hypothetical protein